MSVRTNEVPLVLSFKCGEHYSCANGGLMISYDEQNRCMSETWTPKRADGSYGNSRTRYLIEDDEREFATEEELLDALLEKRDPSIIEEHLNESGKVIMRVRREGRRPT